LFTFGAALLVSAERNLTNFKVFEITSESMSKYVNASLCVVCVCECM